MTKNYLIPDDFKAQAAESGLRFEAYLPPSLAALIVDLVDQDQFKSPSEAAFVAITMLEDIRKYPDLHKELLQRMFADAGKSTENGKAVSSEEVIARLREKAKQGDLEPAVWENSMDRPLFEE